MCLHFPEINGTSRKHLDLPEFKNVNAIMEQNKEAP